MYIVLFLHQTTTVCCLLLFQQLLYIVLFLHQTTTYQKENPEDDWLYIVLFLHQTTTLRRLYGEPIMLYIVLFLHQTTTEFVLSICKNKLYIVLFLHQTTTMRQKIRFFLRCISYYSYIKPQPASSLLFSEEVVYRTIPTSNHNWLNTKSSPYWLYIVLFLHQTTTKLQKWMLPNLLYIVLFLHQTTTLLLVSRFALSCISYYSYIKPQPRKGLPSFLCVVYRTIPTSNHNCWVHRWCSVVLYIVLFLHQTTTGTQYGKWMRGCISYYSYIKPQLFHDIQSSCLSCISYYSYIKPQLFD